MVSRRLLWGLSALAACGLLAACSRPAKITVTPKEVLLRDPGGGKSLTVTVLDAKDNPIKKVKVALQSSAPDVAEVDASGNVTARSSGDAVITAIAGKVSGSAKVRVRLVSSLLLALPETGATGAAGTVVPLRVRATNEKGEPADLEGIAFTSSAPGVAPVDGKGQLTLLSTGKTTVTASVGKTSARLPVEVTVEVPMAVKVTAQAQSVALGQTVPLDFSVISDQGRPMTIPVQCTSSDDKVAVADASGKVTGIGRGTAVITITAGTASNTIKVAVR